jgi:pyruvate dehydrogenase complex dehydrogenase (E1) component
MVGPPRSEAARRRESIATASLQALTIRAQYGSDLVANTIADLGIDPDKPEPRTA